MPSLITAPVLLITAPELQTILLIVASAAAGLIALLGVVRGFRDRDRSEREEA